MSRNEKDIVIPSGMEHYYNDFHFSPAIRDGNKLYCSGVIGVEADGSIASDPAKQFDCAFGRQLGSVLRAAGLGYEDIVEMTTYHVGLQQHLTAFMQVKDRYIAAPYPAWTAIGITELAFPGALVEIKIIAKLRS